MGIGSGMCNHYNVRYSRPLYVSAVTNVDFVELFACTMCYVIVFYIILRTAMSGVRVNIINVGAKSTKTDS